MVEIGFPFTENADFWVSGIKIAFLGRQTAKNENFQKKFFLNLSRGPKWKLKREEQAESEYGLIFPPHIPYPY